MIKYSPDRRVSAQCKDVEAVATPGDNIGRGGNDTAEGFPTAGNGSAAFKLGGFGRGGERGRGCRDQGEAMSQEADESGKANHGCGTLAVQNVGMVVDLTEQDTQ